MLLFLDNDNAIKRYYLIRREGSGNGGILKVVLYGIDADVLASCQGWFINKRKH